MEHSLDAVDRRTFCKYLAGGTIASSGLATVDRATALANDYRTVIDVADEGAARDGSASVSRLVEDLIGDDTLLRFPTGRYFMDEEVRATGFHNLGIVGDGATLVPANYWGFDGEKRLFRLGTSASPGRSLHFESFTVDQQSAHTGIRTIEAKVEDDLFVKNVKIVGTHDAGTWGPGLFTITESDGSGRVVNFRALDGGEESENTPGDIHKGPSGILCNGSHAGSITFKDCVLDAFPDNGLYAAGGVGNVNVVGGHYRNCGTASIRLGVRRGRIEGTTVSVAWDPFGLGQEGIRLQYGDWIDISDVTVNIKKPNGEGLRVLDGVGARVADSDFRMESPAYPPIKIEAGDSNVYLRGLDIEINGSNNAVHIDGDGNDGKVGLSDVLITGDAPGERMRHAILCRRDGAEFRDVNVDQHGGPKRRGICVDADDVLVYHCYMTTENRAMTVIGDDAWIEDCGLTTGSWSESIRLRDGVNGVRLKSNWLPDGIVDLGASNVVESGTSG